MPAAGWVRRTATNRMSKQLALTVGDGKAAWRDEVLLVATAQNLRRIALSAYRMLKRMGTVKSNVSPGMFAGGGGKGCARRTVSIVS